MAEASADQALFTYGALRSAEVQLDTFGRLVAGDDDVLPGFAVAQARIDDARVVDASGAVAHPVLRPTGSDLDKVVGTVLWITEDELDAADEYEVALYRRVSVNLASGRTAWAYVEAEEGGA